MSVEDSYVTVVIHSLFLLGLTSFVNFVETQNIMLPFRFSSKHKNIYILPSSSHVPIHIPLYRLIDVQRWKIANFESLTLPCLLGRPLTHTINFPTKRCVFCWHFVMLSMYRRVSCQSHLTWNSFDVRCEKFNHWIARAIGGVHEFDYAGIVC